MSVVGAACIREGAGRQARAFLRARACALAAPLRQGGPDAHANDERSRIGAQRKEVVAGLDGRKARAGDHDRAGILKALDRRTHGGLLRGQQRAGGRGGGSCERARANTTHNGRSQARACLPRGPQTSEARRGASPSAARRRAARTSWKTWGVLESRGLTVFLFLISGSLRTPPGGWERRGERSHGRGGGCARQQAWRGVGGRRRAGGDPPKSSGARTRRIQCSLELLQVNPKVVGVEELVAEGVGAGVGEGRRELGGGCLGVAAVSRAQLGGKAASCPRAWACQASPSSCPPAPPRPTPPTPPRSQRNVLKLALVLVGAHG